MDETLSFPQQVVQVAHAVIESSPTEQPSLVVLGVKEISKILNLIRSYNIKCYPFYEPYYNNALTAFATEPISTDNRHLFQEFKLLGRKKNVL